MNYELKTERLILTPPKIEDFHVLFKLMKDKVTTTFLTWKPHKNLSETKRLVENLINAQHNDKGYHWCVKFSGEIIGLVSLIDVRRKIRTWTINRAELSYWISNDFQGRGFATESSKAVIEFGFRNLNLHKIIIAHAEENNESKRICEKLEFNQFAKEHHAFFKNNKWHDLIWYEKILNN